MTKNVTPRVTVEVALVGKARGAGSLGDGATALEEAASSADPVGDLECVGR